MVNPNRIKQTRELSRLTQAELAAEIGIAQSSIAHIESGRFEPSDGVLELIAKRLGFPVSFFDQEDPPNFPVGSLLFRAHARIPTTDKDEVYRLGQLAFQLTTGLAKKVNYKVQLRLPQVNETPDEQIDGIEGQISWAQHAAQLTRDAFGLSQEAPIPNLVKAVEKVGVTILALPFEAETCDAYSLWVNFNPMRLAGNPVRPFAILASNRSGDRQRFSLAHELGHLVMHQTIAGSSKEIEDEASKYSSELLLPEKAMRQQITTPVTLTSLAKLKPVWGISIQALIRRAHDLKIITERQYTYLNKQVIQKGWKKDEPIKLPVEKPRVLKLMAEYAYGNPIDYQQLAKDFRLPLSRVKSILDCYASKEQYLNLGINTNIEDNKIVDLYQRRFQRKETKIQG